MTAAYHLPPCAHMLDPRVCDDCWHRLSAPERLERAAWLLRVGRPHDAAAIILREAELVEQAADPIERLGASLRHRRRGF